MILWVFWVNDTRTQVLNSKTLCNVNSTNYWYIQPQTSKWTSESMWMNLFVSRTKRLKSLNYKSVLISMPAKTEGMIAVFLYSIVHTRCSCGLNDVCAVRDDALSQCWAIWCFYWSVGFIKCQRYDALSMWATLCPFSPLNRKHVSSSQRVMTRGASHK